ncbi:39S ribosomal protein L42, mitochondrial [Orchesella cincta]|uniref:Large ribosomal subunit protein mL42 n=1 Tax=Orchesella cincta TaxID=48709 RepID=A0A1D2NJZ9_ORCCI|nr:39S ribosomal protein L42, mitochondrial [Orchesella cincta]
MSQVLYSTLGVLRHVGFSSVTTSQASSLSAAKCLSCGLSSRWYSRFTKRMDSSAQLARKEESQRQEPAQKLSPDSPGTELESGLVFNHGRHNMYICWHPEVPHPYEMTKPIDLAAPVTDSVLKIQSLTPVREAFRQKHHKMVIQELIKLTYATKHRFFGPYGKKKRLVLREMDPNKQKRNREYL